MTMNILITDDERLERLAVRKVVESTFGETCHVIEAVNGRYALEAIANNVIHIAVLDIKMPGISGIDVARELKANQPDCQIIMLTGFTYFNYAKESISIGVLEFLVKPFLNEELSSALTKAQQLIERNKKELKKELESVQHHDKNWIVEIKEEIKNRYTEDLSMEEMANFVGFSTSYFSRMFKHEFGCNFVDYITQLRLEKACELLANPTVTIREICFEVGYSEPNYFTRVFKKAYNLTPTQYQKNAIMTKKSY